MDDVSGAATSSGLEFLYCSEWKIGDLLWSKIPGHPWWPCMVAYSPISGVFSKIVKKKNSLWKAFHVQYFGSAQRGWTVDGGVMAYLGRHVFDTLPDKLRMLPKSFKRDRVLGGLRIPSTRLAQWEIAVSEAESALRMTPEERVQKWTYEYAMSTTKQLMPDSSDVSTNTPVLESNQKSSEQSNKKQKISASQQNISEKPEIVKMNCIAKSNSKKKQKWVKAMTNAVGKESELDGLCPTNASLVEKKKLFYGKVFKPNGLTKGVHSHMMSLRKRAKCFGSLSKNAEEYEVANCLSDDLETNAEFSLKQANPHLQYQWYKMSNREEKTSDLLGNNLEGNSTRRERMSSRISSNAVNGMSENGIHYNETSSLKDEESTIQDIGDIGWPDKVCSICEVTGNVITCEGSCRQSFHRGCLDLANSLPSYQCPECLTGKHKCFSCKTDDGEVQKCSVSGCGRYYHQKCLNKIAISISRGNRLVCSLHACHSCFFLNSKRHFWKKGEMVQCIRCPIAYHGGESCVAAGSIFLASNYILCAKHFSPRKRNKGHLHVNAKWCSICSKSGNLIGCKLCSGAFHLACLNMNPPDDGNYFCKHCTDGKPLQYGSIVWAKFATFRWWPAEVLRPDTIPENIRNLEHTVGEFPVHFFGSHNYHWIHRGRTFLFREGHKGIHHSSSRRPLSRDFQIAVGEATEAFQKWKLKTRMQ